MGFMVYGLESRVYRAYNIGLIGLIVPLRGYRVYGSG